MKRSMICQLTLVCLCDHARGERPVRRAFYEYLPFTGERLPSFGMISEIVRAAFRVGRKR